jgi:hypothetical protein
LIPLGAAEAQRINGTIHESVTGVPVAGAVVSVLDSAGRPSARTLTDERGRYAVVWQATAARMRVVRIGFRPAERPLPRALPRDSTIDLTLDRLPVTLEAMRVSSRAVCSASGDAQTALDLWDQVRAALLNAIVARTAMPARVLNLTYQRQLDPRTRRVTQQAFAVTAGVSSQPFIAALPAAELAANGYTAGRGVGQTFYAPDADVLFDDSFTGTHCFGVQTGDGAHKGLVALTFEPRTQGRRDSLVDVRGELWIDPSGPALVQLDFTYTGTDRVAQRAGMGGTIHFESMSNGVVFIDNWSLVLAVLRQSFDKRYVVANLGESGGTVLQARWPDSTQWTGRIGSVRGRVSQKKSPDPAPHVLVSIEGMADTTMTDEAGRFEFGLLPAGLYSLHVIDTTLELFNRPRTASAEARVGRGDTVEVNFEVPSRAAFIADLCSDQRPVPKTSTILGRISDGANQWPRDLRIESVWLGDIGAVGVATIFTERKQVIDVDDGGRFHVCGVVRERPIRMKALIGKLPIADTAVTVYDSVTRVVEWKLRPATFARLQSDGSALTGRVVHQGDGKPIPDAEVWVIPGDVHTRTDSSGQFQLYGLQPGKQFVQVRRIGFTEQRDTVSLRGGQEVVRQFALEGQFVTLDTMRTTSPLVQYRSPRLQGFETRRAEGFGRFIAEDVMRKNDNRSVSGLVPTHIPGISIVGYMSASYATMTRSAAASDQSDTTLRADLSDRRSPIGCWVAVYVDGIPLYTGPPAAAPDLGAMRVSDYAGVEFYAGMAAIPPRFDVGKAARCGVLLLWTREQ